MTARSARAARIRARYFPESQIDGFSRVDNTVEFYLRVNALLGAELRVVDFGAGRGQWAAEDPSVTRVALHTLRGKVREVIGVDVDDAVLTNPTLDSAVVIGPDDRLPFADGTVDVVVADWTFEHLADPAAAARELTRILSPGGWICARTPNKWGYVGLGARLVPNRRHTAWLARLQPFRREVDVFPVRYRLNTRAALRTHFPPSAFRDLSYPMGAEPVYAGGSRILWMLTRALFRFQPRRCDPVLAVFLQKRHRPARG